MGQIFCLIIGGFAGFIAEKIMKSDMGIFANVGLGILGAFLAGIVFSLVGVQFAGPVGYLISGVVGACALIFINRGIKGRRSGDVEL